jgi:two-component system, sensor histidine kinase RpfC
MYLDIVEGATDKTEPGLRNILKSQAKLRAYVATPFVVIEIYLLLFYPNSISEGVLALTAGYYLYIMAVQLLVRFWTSMSSRHLLVATAILDPTVLTAWLLMTGEYGSLMVGQFLFTILGFGFRTGRPLMHLCQLTTVCCFILVLVCVPFWRLNPTIWFALMVPLVAIPIYAGGLVRTLRQSRELAEHESQAKSELLAKVSHELRTPLSGIISATELLAAEAGQELVTRRTDTILNLSNELLKEINDLLDEAKFGARATHLEYSPVDLSRQLALVREALEATAAKKGIILRVTLDPDISGQVESDAHHLGRVLLNLTSNAVKFTDEGIVLVAVDLLEDSVSSYRLRFSVTDTGIGIPDSFREMIFEPFSQVDQGPSRRYGGTGLGLALSRKIVELMGGRLRFESEPGKGSRFWFDVSLNRSSEPVSAMTTGQAPADRSIQIVPKRILVAEDNETNLLLLRELLEIDGHEVITCSSGMGALDVLADQKVDLLLLDYNLGDMDGVRLLQTYHYGTTTPAPALFLTADTTQLTATRLREVASATGILYKPITLAKLRQAIGEQLWCGSDEVESPDEIVEPIPPSRPARPMLSAVAVSPLDRDVIDELKSVSARPEFFPNLLSEAENDIQRSCGQIMEAIALQNYSLMRDAAHALKGVSANVGAVRLFALASKLMIAPREDVEAATDRWSVDLGDELRATVEALKKEVGDARAAALANGTTSLHSG